MSYHSHFSLSVSVAKSIRVPTGTIEQIEEHIRQTETALGFKREKYRDNPERWERCDVGEGIDDKVACEAVSRHNEFVVWLYDRLAEWSKKAPDGKTESLTVKKSAALFPFLCQLQLSPGRWTADFFQEQMDEMYEVLRGRPTNGITFDAKPLTIKQADAVINLVSSHLDLHDIRLAVPDGHDSLSRSDDGGYSWCDKCFKAIAESDCGSCRKRKCPINAEMAMS